MAHAVQHGGWAAPGRQRRGGLTCPTCSRRAEPAARYCPACYTVFPSERLPQRHLQATRAGGKTWKAPILFALVFGGLWFAQIDANDTGAEPGSLRAVAGDAKRNVVEWASSTGIIRDPATSGPAWSLDNDSRLGCATGSTCRVRIRFASGEVASFVISRPRFGGARLSAVDPGGADLLSTSIVAHVVGGKEGTVSITRTPDGGWTVADQQVPARAQGSNQ